MNEFVVFLLFAVAAGVLFSIALLIERIISPRVKAEGMGEERVESSERSVFPYRVVGFQYFMYALVFVILEAVILPSMLLASDIRSLGLSFSIFFAVSLLYLILLVRYVLAQEVA